MSRSYTPGLKVLEKTQIEKLRQLPLKGEVHSKLGDTVSPEDIIASTEIPGNVQMLNVANKLNIEPGNIPECMLVDIDDKIEKNQIIAETKGVFGFFKSQVKSPIDGLISNISDITGQVLLSEPPIAVEVDAYTHGEVIDVIPEEGVIIKTQGVFIQGILGIGGESRGELNMVCMSPDEELSPELLNEDHKGKVIVGGSFMTLEAFHKAQSIGVAGIVVGGFDYDQLSQLLGYNLGVAITGSEELGTSLIITEGFGKITMAKRTFELLQKYTGKFTSINGATQIRAGVIRPEIIISNDEKMDFKKFETEDMAISNGSTVRVIRTPYFGKVGIVKSLPHQLTQMESETMVRVAEIEFENGRSEIIPRANLELILS